MAGHSYLNICLDNESGREMLGYNKKLHRTVIKDIICGIVRDLIKVSIVFPWTRIRKMGFGQDSR